METDLKSAPPALVAALLAALPQLAGLTELHFEFCLHYSGASCRLTAEGDLRSLLALPALTHLRLPHVSADTLAHLRLLAACSGRQPAVRIEKSPPWQPLRDPVPLWADSFAADGRS